MYLYWQWNLDTPSRLKVRQVRHSSAQVTAFNALQASALRIMSHAGRTERVWKGKSHRQHCAQSPWVRCLLLWTISIYGINSTPSTDLRRPFALEDSRLQPL
eukprot:gb/GEZJ01005694.1/.p2 GENE.gb/GEZJ01005694.1/~~gb/GEZJ01005694.1/.p2  ORF type:complete len:102 (-),score=3.82 gb/GEZJ01005694.1/:77-382(-)